MNNNSTGVNWDESIWQDINDAVVKEVAKVRVAQKVFPTIALDMHPTEIPNDVIIFDRNSPPRIAEGRTKPFIEIYQEFPLTVTQVNRESQIKTCKTLARMAAKAIALAEDTIIFQGNVETLPANVQADLKGSAERGLLGEASPENPSDNDLNSVSQPIVVQLAKGSRPGLVWGEELFSAVANGIAKLTSKAQAPKYALFLPIKAYADTFVPPSSASLVTTAERIKPLVEGGFYGTGTLPGDRGLLVALAGDPTSLYIGREATTEFVRKEGSNYYFRVVERVQFVARDPRAFILFTLDQPGAQAAEGQADKVQEPEPIPVA